MTTRGGVESARPAAPRSATLARAPAAPTVPWTWVLVVVGVALALYANSLGGALLYDDVNAIRNNPLVRNGEIVGILTEPSWWGNTRGPLWRPLTTLTFALGHALHGLAPFGYHVVNVVVHAAVSVLVLVVFARATVAPRTALAAALLFAAHPIHTEAVASVVGRAELIAALGFFLAWWAWLAADAADGRRVPASVWMMGVTGAYFLAMCGKENAVMLPAVLAFADVLARRGESWTALCRRRLARYAVLTVTAAVFVVLRGIVIGQLTPSPDLMDNPLGALASGDRFMTAIKVIGLYGLRLVFPLWLSADYSFAQVTPVDSPLDPTFLGGLAVLLGAAALLWWAWRRLPALALGLGVLGLTFVVVSNLFFLIGTIMGERLAYLPSAGFCLALGAALAHVSGQRELATGRAPVPWSLAFVVPLVAVVLLYGTRTVARNAVWREPLGFFTVMVADAPGSARSHRELGTVLADVGRFDEARRAFERSLAIKPEDAATLYNFGNALSHAGQLDEAVALYRRAVAANPSFVEALENLGTAESLRGDQQAALAAMRRALALTPRSALLQMNIANTLFRAGALPEARTAYEQALSLAPDAEAILTNYGSFLYAQGDYSAAVRVFERIVPPAPARALVALAASQRALGRGGAAQATQANAERLYPQDAGVRQMGEMLRRDAAGSGSPP